MLGGVAAERLDGILSKEDIRLIVSFPMVLETKGTNPSLEAKHLMGRPSHLIAVGST